MEADDSFQLNITTDRIHAGESKKKLSRNERISKNKQERSQYEKTIQQALERHRTGSGLVGGPEAHGEKALATATSRHPSDLASNSKARKRKESSGLHESEVASKKSRVTFLFSKNPEIPNLGDVTVDVLKEDVFSSSSFASLSLHPFMVTNLESVLGFSQMTAVQQQAIPHILGSRDVLVKSQTGSGKTLAFGVPVVQMLQSQSPHVKRLDGPYALVIVPTRELALQCFDTFQKLVKPFTWIVPGCIMGGERRKSEKARLRKGINILISTPGRLVDHLQNTRSLQLSHVKWLVIDEADRLLDMGFEKEVSQVITVLNERSSVNRQTILLSATLSSGVERLAGMSLQDAIKIHVGHDGIDPQPDQPAGERGLTKLTNSPRIQESLQEESKSAEKFATPESLRHHFMLVPSKLRLVTLAAFIMWKCKFASKASKVIVFFSTQDSVDFHHNLLTTILSGRDEEDQAIQGAELEIHRLHGDMKQKERTKVFMDYSTAASGVLFCTDVAARGLDLPHVKWIIQYNAPGSATDYIHRVGRTARIGSRGNALLFLTPSEAGYVKVLAEQKISMTEVSVDDILKTLLIQNQEGSARKRGKWSVAHTVKDCAMALQGRFTSYVSESKDMHTLARKAYQSYIRSYAAYPSSLKYLFHIKHMHLGHVATSFALQDSPSTIGDIVGRQATLKKKEMRKSGGFGTSQGGGRQKRGKQISEFGSGLDTGITMQRTAGKSLKRLTNKPAPRRRQMHR